VRKTTETDKETIRKILEDHGLWLEEKKGKKSLVLSLALLLAGCRPAGVENTAKPSIYITRTDHVWTLEGDEVWILEYTVNGEFQAPLFDSREGMIGYREYLDTIGTVYRTGREGAGEGER
jgi:hypothetical protein